jgi:hypothetical protein
MRWEVETVGSKDFGPCDCCGGTSRTVWGYLRCEGEPSAAYYVQWTLGEVHLHGAHVDLIVGRWGHGTSANDRSAVSMEFRREEGRRGLMLTDAAHRPAASSSLCGKALARAEVVGTPLAETVFEMVDAIWLQDRRIAELTNETA